MASVLVVATSKGGTGKTTIAASLAAYWRDAGKRVAVLDTDPNQAATRWIRKGESYKDVESQATADEHAIIGAVQDLGQRADLVIVDTAGFGNQSMIYSVGIADLVLIPVMADEASLFEAVKMKKVIESASALTRRSIAFRTVLNRVKRATVVRHTERQLENLGLNPVEARIGDRAIFQEASYHGASPQELAPKTNASLEIRRLARELEPALFATA
ncbi:chromosome partitioning protein ParA [Thalassobaculum fulvum]|jgi:chromosome partitioning protein|uniref:Chromosome partitioning protein ParA n=1 Tax=Thalassobaculum fulvum TaxID=1633335 RepID=A0A918XR53_9PROT|nr:ParA family protein [Thalassobaculum fulvum]GHD49173.1 chromosome partitioning protein ParA [Thalassobaculum fulvum]